MAFDRIGAEDQIKRTNKKRNFLQIMQDARRNGANNTRGEEGLTIREQMFVEQYILNGGNAAQAYLAIRQVKKNKETTIEKAGFNGSLMLKKPHVKAAIEARRKDLRQTFKVEEEKIILELARIAFSNLTNYYFFDHNGNIDWRDPQDLTEDQQAAIQDISIFENVVTNTRRIAKMKLYNKQTALTELAKILGLYDEYTAKKQPQVNINIEEILSAMPPGIGEAVRERIVFDVMENTVEIPTSVH